MRNSLFHGKLNNYYAHFTISMRFVIACSLFFVLSCNNSPAETEPREDSGTVETREVFVPVQMPVVEDEGGELESPFALVYEKVAPAVVLVNVEGEKRQKSSQLINPWEWFNQEPHQRRENQQEERETVPRGMGSGVIIDRDGHIITNNHVIADAVKITVKLDENKTYDAEIVGTDFETDIAVIKIDLDGERLPPENVAELGDSDTIKPGDYAIAIGNPIGLERTITIGVVSAVGRKGIGQNPRYAVGPTYQNFIQTDAQINPGNSGGALCDINGRVIGINDMYAARFAGIGFAIPVNLAYKIAGELMEQGEVKRGFVGLGADIESEGVISETMREALSLPDRNGFIVGKVEEGYPAAEAGLKPGDVITSLDGDTVKNYEEFRFMIADKKPGDTVKIGYYRNGKKETTKLTLADREEYLASQGINSEMMHQRNQAPQEGVQSEWRGIVVQNVNPYTIQRFNLGEIDKGVVVVEVKEGTPAEDVNLMPGDVILEINWTEIKNVEDFTKVKVQVAESDRAILFHRLRVSSNGQITRGFVAVPAE